MDDINALARSLGGVEIGDTNPDALARSLGGAPQSEPIEPRTRLGKLVHQILNAPRDLALGVKQPLDAAAQMAARATGWGVPETEAAMAPKPESEGAVSDIVRGLPAGVGMALATRGASFGPTLAGAAGTGAAYGAGAGALTPVYDATSDADFWKKKAAEVGKGGALGGAASTGLNVVGRMVAPTLANGVDLLRQSGIGTTLGQRLGGMAKSLEDKLTSVPIIGDLIISQRLTGITDFNRAVYRRALEPLGPEAVAVADRAPVGNEGIKQVGDYLSASYDAALARSVPNVVTPQFSGSLQNLGTLVPQSMQGEYGRIITKDVLDKITPAGTLTPSVAKSAESELGRMAREYRGSPNPEHRLLSNALSQAQAEVRNLVAANNPSIAPVIQATNNGWATIVQMENAGKMLGAKDGIFTPAQFLNAVRGSDKSIRDRQFARGDVKNQDLAQAADRVLPSKIPDSGTPGRLMAASMTGAGGGGLAHMAGMLPEGIAGLTAASLPYLPGIGPLVTGALTVRPRAMLTMGDFLKDAAPFLAPSAVAAGLSGP